MSVTPGKGRMSAIPTPGKSSIPTPGFRPRSTSSAGQRPSFTGQEDEYASRAFQDAIRANDPAQHRGPRTSDVSIASSQLSPSSSTSSVFNGPRSLSAGVRPSSSASSSSAMSSGRTPSAKTQSTRPPSRTSDVFARSASRAGRGFEVGDNVRIESLGFEGVLRYFGEIDGKPGMWAGVELGGGFAGKGKNNGSVAGKQYFTCPPNCGVFVASTKLSAPTAGLPMSRPSSVASVRSGRMTPSFSASGRMTPSALPTIGNGRKTPSMSISNGRVTPSMSTGRVTPSISNGRVTPAASAGRKTPSLQTPTARPRSTTAARSLVTPARTTNVPNNITPGSRAAKYVGMTAKQLAGTTPGSPKRGAGSASPTRTTVFGSPMLPPRSPTRSVPGSPFNTPKPLGSRPSGIGMGLPTSNTPSKSRPSFSNTPRARIPSTIAMPPPPSPSNSSRSVSYNGPLTPADAPLVSDLEMNNKLISERIAALTSSKTPASPRPESRVSTADSAHVLELQSQVERLQARLEASEDENKRLRARADGAEREASSRIEALVAERDQNAARITELETAARTAERALTERTSQMEALQRAAEQAKNELEKVRSEGETKLRDVQNKLEDKESLLTQLKEALNERDGEQSNSDAQLKAKNAEIALLESRVKTVSTELAEERKNLNEQIDELRRAGQEMVALYEERLSAADTRRYELEDLVVTLEEHLKAQARPVSPETLARKAATAAEIDNEMLREQVQHLQKRIATLEDDLEETRAMNERDEAAVRERIKRYKEREETVRKELAETRTEMELVRMSEEKARVRVEEVEEALRENTVALENARAEIETLRNEIANLEGMAAAARSASSDKLSELAPRANSERTRLQEEIADLKQQLSQVKTQSSGGADVHDLEEELHLLQEDRETLHQSLKRTQAELADERAIVEELRALANERTAELDTIRKKLNREGSVNGHEVKPPASPSSKHDLSVARDEITGLKHIVQQLQKENDSSAKRCKVLEAENKLLLSETEQLREELKVLEEDVERSLAREEAVLSGENMPSTPSTPSLDDIQALQQSYKDLKAKYETEVEQLRKKVADLEMKSARQVHDLNKEIGELESLIESKIYREDELELEIERLKEKLARQKKSSKTDLFEEPHARPPSSSSTLSSTLGESGEEVCEICERPGHDIFTCDLLKDDTPPASAKPRDDQSEMICEDCEERGHTAANCPHSLDVF
ncbi:hypothetical protein OH76DRAFT_1397294 [Lentinus brumalis]|uniref:CAP-Gly domain-containing protein n=1 Tax=Lentinus brumalis TaxID=2498619 RepID=A0A371DQZ4_9APHY|nr:hypothetical protein OH76DRAFT_1397294 [Polyporus brumalis]